MSSGGAGGALGDLQGSGGPEGGSVGVGVQGSGGLVGNTRGGGHGQGGHGPTLLAC